MQEGTICSLLTAHFLTTIATIKITGFADQVKSNNRSVFPSAPVSAEVLSSFLRNENYQGKIIRKTPDVLYAHIRGELTINAGLIHFLRQIRLLRLCFI